jgi:hydrogenase expression/formation protein HypC
MCVAVPAEVTAVDEDGADVQVSGRTRRVSHLLVPDVRVGEYVLVASGMITDRLTEDEARDRMGLFDQLLEVLDEDA